MHKKTHKEKYIKKSIKKKHNINIEFKKWH